MNVVTQSARLIEFTWEETTAQNVMYVFLFQKIAPIAAIVPVFIV
tara:strand:- start:333 stop:467 length:135 start_codon:yes stop_codon:yes gene_type:complete